MTSSSNIDIEKFSLLVGQIYDAATGTEHWPVFMQSLIEAFHSKSCMLRAQNLNSDEVGIWISQGMQPSYLAKYREHYVKIDPILRMVESHAVGTVLQTEFDMPGNYKSGEFFNDYIKPQKTECIAGAMLTNSESEVAIFGIHRPGSIGDFTQHEMSIIEKLVPHIQRAIQTNRQLEGLENKIAACGGALDRLPIGVIFVDAGGQPKFTNRKADKLSAANCGLKIKPDQVVATRMQDTLALQKLIFQATKSALRKGGSLLINDPVQEETVSVLVTPINNKTGFKLGADSSNIAAAIFISCENQQYSFPLQILNLLYGLTPAEAKLASAIANGMSIEEVSEQQCISKYTVRNHLKSCFHKTGVKRQSALVKLILCGVPALGSDDTDYRFDGDQ